MAIVDSILMEIDQEAKTTQRVLDRIPEDKLTWKPHAKSYSLGQLALHIARGQGFWPTRSARIRLKSAT